MQEIEKNFFIHEINDSVVELRAVVRGTIDVN